MDARELTKRLTDISNRVFILEKNVEYLTQEVVKQRLLQDDIRVDIQMMSKDARRGR